MFPVTHPELSLLLEILGAMIKKKVKMDQPKKVMAELNTQISAFEENPNKKAHCYLHNVFVSKK